MQKFKRLLVGIVTFIILLAVTPVTAHAEWRQDKQGWWYADGNSWANRWKLVLFQFRWLYGS